MRATLLGLTLWTGLTLCACGGEERLDTHTPDPVPPTPEAALRWVREAADSDSQILLRSRLARWPVDHESFRDAEETRIALTWRIRTALQDGKVESALPDYTLLEDRFADEGVSPEGRRLPGRILRAGIFEEALARARERIEGGRPNRAAAQRALAVAPALLEPQGGADHKLWIDLARVDQWVDLARVEELAPPWNARLLGASGPRVLVFADDFTLGEVVFAGVLERWQRDGRDGGLRVLVVPVVRGQVRMGLRLIPAESVEEELASIRTRCRSIGLEVAGAPEERASTSQLETWWGLGAQDVAILVIDTEGRIVGRMAGTNLDPRPLDRVIQRLVSR